MSKGMTDYRLVPVEKLKEWEATINTIALQTAFDIADDIAQYSYAPDVQGEPVAWGAFYSGGKYNGQLHRHDSSEEQIDRYIAIVHGSNDSLTLRKGCLYTAPQPVEQQTAPALSKFLEKEEWNDAFAQGFDAGFNSDEKPAPDVTQLVEALEASTHRLHEQADGEDDCRCSQCHFVQLRDAALAAHRKGGDI